MAHTGGDLLPYLTQWIESCSSSATPAWNLAALIYRTGCRRRGQSDQRLLEGSHGPSHTGVRVAEQGSRPQHTRKGRKIYLNEAFAEELVAAAGVVS